MAYKEKAKYIFECKQYVLNFRKGYSRISMLEYKYVPNCGISKNTFCNVLNMRCINGLVNPKAVIYYSRTYFLE